MKNITNLNLKWHKARTLFKVVVIQILSFLLANYILLIRLNEYVTDKKEWVNSVIISNILTMIVFIIVYICMNNKAKNTMYFVNLKNATCVKNEREIRYKKIEYTQSTTQKMFGLCTLKFKSETQTITLKDVSIEALKYLE